MKVIYYKILDAEINTTSYMRFYEYLKMEKAVRLPPNKAMWLFGKQ